MTGIDPRELDPEAITTAADLRTAFKALCAGKSYRKLNAAAHGRLPSSTLTNLFKGPSLPSDETLTAFLMACGLPEDARGPWVGALERVKNAHRRQPAGAVRVGNARARLLGVHAAVSTGHDETELPAYVSRDFDQDLRAAIRRAAADGGFVLLTGTSCVGKTRAMFEAVRAELPEWWLLHPTDAPALRSFAAEPTPRTVLWLDELHRYLKDAAGLPVGTVRSLINSGAVLVATLWPDDYQPRIIRRPHGGDDPYDSDRALLDLARLIEVPAAFTPDERRRAEKLASADRRLRIALDTPEAGFTQVMAAGPDLVRRWEQAPAEHCYGQVAITAALDARRVGATAALSREFFEAAVPGYLTSSQQATAPADWLDRALNYATAPLANAAASALLPIPAGMGQLGGYEVADYLRQHGIRSRRTQDLPDSAWRALVDHHSVEDAFTLVISAENRGRFHDAEGFARTTLSAAWLSLVGPEVFSGDHSLPLTLVVAHATRDPDAAQRLATFLERMGRVDEAVAVLLPYADHCDSDALHRIAYLLADDGRVDAAVDLLRPHIDANSRLAVALARLFVREGRRDDATALLRQHAHHDLEATQVLAEILAATGRAEDGVALLRPHAGTPAAAVPLARLLAANDRVDDAVEVLKCHAENDTEALRETVRVLEGLGRIDDAIEVLQKHTANPRKAALDLARLMNEHGRIDEAIAVLRPRAATDGFTALKLAELLQQQERFDEVITLLHPHTSTGPIAALNVAGLLERQGRIDEAVAVLRPHAESGRASAARLADIMCRNNRVDEAVAIFRPHAFPHNSMGLFSAESVLVNALVADGRTEDAISFVRPHARDDYWAARHLGELLTKQGQIEEAFDFLQPHVVRFRGADYIRVDLAQQAGRTDLLEQEAAAGTPGAAEALQRLNDR